MAAQAADSTATQLFQSWLAVFNEGRREKIEAFYKEHFPSRADSIDNVMNFRRSTGGFDLRKTEESTASRFTALLQEHDADQFARVTLESDPKAPGQISDISLRAIPRPAEFAIPRTTEGEALKAFRAKLDDWAAHERFSGAALVAHDGKPVFTAVYGMADRENKIQNALDTRFRMGSMNKMFTATAILQLVQSGKIKLEDPLGKYLSDYPNKDVATKVTIHQLLTHTGGTGDIFGPEYRAHRLELKTLQDYAKLYGSRGLAFEPGSKWDYSNYGFVLLGLVIERVSGTDYYSYVREHIFKPAGMTRTDSEPEEVSVTGRSKGYMTGQGSWMLNTDTLPYRGTSAGGGYTTVEDLLRFANALTSYKLLDKQHTELLTSGKVETGRGKYAYGFEDNVEGGVRSIGHNGGAPGMNGELRIYPDSHYVVAVLTNMDQGATRASQWIGARLPK